MEETEGETIIRIPSYEFKNLYINSIIITTDSMFQRKFSYYCGAEILYNLTFDNLTITDTTIDLMGRAYNYDDDFTISIANGDDKPLNMQGIEISFQCKRLVFKSQGKGNIFFYSVMKM